MLTAQLDELMEIADNDGLQPMSSMDNSFDDEGITNETLIAFVEEYERLQQRDYDQRDWINDDDLLQLVEMLEG